MSSDEYYYFSSRKYHPLSLLQNHIDEGNGGLTLSDETEDRIKILRRELKVMDSFLGLQSFTNECIMLNDLIRTVQDLFQYAIREIRTNYLGYSTRIVLEKIWTTKLEIRAKYSTSLPHSSSEGTIAAAAAEFVKKFVDTVARNLSDLLKLYAPCSSLLVPGPRRQIEVVVKELKLLRNFVFFISDRCTDPQIQHAFFTHGFVMAVRAAIAVWMNLPDHDNGKRLWASIEMNVSVTSVQIMMQPIQPHIRKICIDFLQSLKSKPSGWHPDIRIEYVADFEAGFLETLIHCLEEMPSFSKHEEVAALEAQKAILLEMLYILRPNLIDLPKEDLKSHLQDVDALIIDVGLLFFSLYDSADEKEDIAVGALNQVPVLDFSSVIQGIQAVIYLVARKSFQSKSTKIDGLGSVDIILDNLKELISCYSDSLTSIKSQIQTVQQQLEQFQKQHVGYQYLAAQVIPKAYEVEHVVFSCINKFIPEWCLVRWIGDIIEEITLMMRDVAEIHEKKSDFVLHTITEDASAHTSQDARITSMKEEMVGFDEVVDKLRWQLIRGSSKLDVISVVGMAGLGKTTLANKLYHDKLVVPHFDVRAECCVSQRYARKDLLLAILRGVKDTVISDITPENELADRLRRLLLVKRYLILVDDVWETIAWDDLKPCFYDANNGSRIILTTRLGDVASHAKLVSDPHFLRFFSREECWMLLQNKVFNGKRCPFVLEDIGQKIAHKCGGLPLSVVLVAGILETIEKEKKCWEQVATYLGSHIQAKSEDIINLSYQNLPYHLKPCFLYFGTFIEDEQIHISKLIWLWTAEGLINTHTEKLSEDTAAYYLENLIERNLVMVSKKSTDGKIKACRIHDLLLDFCRKKAKVENFLEWIKGYKGMDTSIFQNTRRLSLYSQGTNVAEWSSICSLVSSFRFRDSRNIVLSSIDNATYTFDNFKFLRVLDLELTLLDSFPEALTCLRYVAVRIVEDSSLLFSGNYSNLETLIVKGLGGRVLIPDTIWKMVKLRHLHIYNLAIFTLFNVQEFLRSPSKMHYLQTLSSAWFSCVDDADNILAKTPNLRKLRCEVLKFNGLFPAFNNLTKLEMLKFSSGREWIKVTQLNFPPILKKLTLFNSRIHSLDHVANLPRLEVLKLLQVTINFDVWEVTNEQFPELKFLKLQSVSFSEWNVSDEAFPILEHLVLRRCRHLKEIPCRFEDYSSLKSVEIISCNESLAKSAMAVRETLIDNSGTSGFEVFIHK